MKLLPALCSSVFVLTACAQQSAQMPNPASAYCVEKGGKITIKNTEQGQIGICTLPDGSEVEEWELYRRENQQ